MQADAADHRGEHELRLATVAAFESAGRVRKRGEPCDLHRCKCGFERRWLASTNLGPCKVPCHGVAVDAELGGYRRVAVAFIAQPDDLPTLGRCKALRHVDSVQARQSRHR